MRNINIHFSKAGKTAVLFIAMALLTAIAFGSVLELKEKGFDLSQSIIDTDDLLFRGPKKDGIPAINYPVFIKPEEAALLDDNDLVIGLSINGENRAYPLNIMNWHEIVNDEVSGTSFAVTWCPLTQSAVVFSRKINNNVIEFGVSGLLYNSNLVMYDLEFSGLWPQLQLGAATGSMSSQKLSLIPSIVATWEEWKKLHPDTVVLSTRTGHRRNYFYDPYRDYQLTPDLVFPLKKNDRRLPAKTTVIGIRIDNTAKAYPLDMFRKMKSPVVDRVNGKIVKIHSVPGYSAFITDGKGRLLPGIKTYWFAWSAFNVDTLIYEYEAK